MNNRNQILDMLKQKPCRVADLAWELGISTQAVHRHLNKLLQSEIIIKNGSAPRVFYSLHTKKNKLIFPDLNNSLHEFIEEHYAYSDPSGFYYTGIQAFCKWVEATGQSKSYVSLATAYQKIRQEATGHFANKKYISGLKKLKTTFDQVCLRDIFYQDFYSLTQFGKTRLGHLLTMGKSGQHKASIAKLAPTGKNVILNIIAKYNIEAISFLPHSIPRKIAFLHEYKRLLQLPLPEIEIVKAFSGGIPIAQKSLSKVKERIENAQNTIFIKSTKIPYKRILMIDDAIGSGATMNETACKLKKQFKIEQIYGFAIAGSYKGFEVIADV